MLASGEILRPVLGVTQNDNVEFSIEVTQGNNVHSVSASEGVAVDLVGELVVEQAQTLIERNFHVSAHLSEGDFLNRIRDQLPVRSVYRCDSWCI